MNNISCESGGSAVQFTSLWKGMLGYALLSSRDLGECLSRYLRYQHLLCPQLKACLSVTEENAYLSVCSNSQNFTLDHSGYYHFVSQWLGIWHRLGSLVTGKENLFNTVEFDLPDPVERYVKSFNDGSGLCKVCFSCQETRGIFSSELLSMPLAYSSRSIQDLRLEQGGEVLKKLGSSSELVEKINRLLVSHIGPPPAMEAVSDRLCMSVRTLHRHLQRDRTSYQQLVIDYRLALAKCYLAKTSLPANEIASLVGYADTANFYRTFRQVAGLTPKKYRIERSGDLSGGIESLIVA